MSKNGNINKEFHFSDASKHLKKNAFTVPEMYFETSRETLLLHGKIMQQGEGVFRAPVNHEEDLKNRIMARIGRENGANLPLKEGFSVPEHYFSQLEDRIVNRCRTSETPVRNLKSYPNWLRYAVAACLFLGLGWFGWMYFNPNVIPDEQRSAVLINEVDTDDIIEYLAMYSESGDLEYLSDQLSDDPQMMTDAFSSEEIEAYLEGEF